MEDRKYEEVYEIVRMIPRGKVATYGQIASMTGRFTPRMVGYAMAAVKPHHNVPWHRVINRQGRISMRASGDICQDQKELLQQEGIMIGTSGRIDLNRFLWDLK